MDSIAAKKTIKANSINQAVELPDIILPAPYYLELNNTTLYLKRAMDLSISVALLICVFSWVFPILFLLIKLSSKGPVFFVQKRIGADEKIFNCYKFRSMYINTLADVKEAAENDERITPIGKWLRKLYIDELPQIFNVIRGEMSIIGPRPHMLLHHKNFSSRVPNYNRRHLVKPGITGLAQIKGYHDSVSDYYQISGRTRLDLFYVKNMSLMLDLKILTATFLITFRLKKVV
jgi:putative colanic acid biosynthesis UDP-glucose lipid carrier transferase